LKICSVGDLLGVKSINLIRCKNAGVRTIRELSQFKREYSYLQSCDAEEEAALDTLPMVSLSSVFASSLESIVKRIDVEQCFFDCYGSEFEYILSHMDSYKELLLKPAYDEQMNEAVRNLLLDMFTEAAKRKDIGTKERTRIVSAIPLLTEYIRYLKANYRFQNLSRSVRMLLQRQASMMFKKLSARCQNSLRRYEDLSVLVKSIIEKEELSPNHFQSCGEKTFKEFMGFYSDFQRCYYDVVASIYENGDAGIVTRLWIEQLEKEYPFLLTKECEFLSDYEMNAKEIPALYVIYRYINREDSSRNIVYRSYFGLEPDGVQHTLSDIANRLKITSERVRQIAASKILVKGNLETLVESVSRKIRGNFISDLDPIWADLIEYNHLEMSRRNLMQWVCSFCDTYRFMELKENQRMYLVKKELIDNVRVGMFMNEVRRLVNKLKTKDEELDIRALFMEINEIQNIDEGILSLFPIFMECFQLLPNTEILDDFHLLMKANKLDKPLVIESILLNNNAPMSFEEIWDEYNSMYPNDALREETQLRSIILRNHNILPKGKTGIYVHKDWAGEYTGSLTDYLCYILDLLGEPISCHDIFDLAKEQYPNTTEKSIHALMMGDVKKRFIAFEGGLYGLVDKEYDGYEIIERKVVKRKMSERRILDFEQFVVGHKRFPTLSGSEYEISLARWKSNVQKGIILLSDPDSKLFNSLFDIYRDYPQSAIENRFKMACDSVKVIVSETLSMPTLEDSAYEYNWFKKSLKNYTTYTDNRKMYFEDLLLFLRDYGFQ
jgi:hypothetical protein